MSRRDERGAMRRRRGGVRAWARGAVIALLSAGSVTAGEPPRGLAEAPFAARSGLRGATMFVELSSAETGIVTENRYDDPAMWNERYAEFTVGALGTGMAIADYDADGRPDIFVVSKTESCRLFRNLGGWKFEDVTERAGVGDGGMAAKVWKQGATFVDVNNDGRLDLYVCRFDAANLLYMNQGDGTFREEAAARGLALRDASVMGAFHDYDRDGWLDVFVQTNLPESIGRRQRQQNRLFRNNGDGTFAETTERAGIGGQAQGHSAIWWDFDEDGWPDLYVANDFTPPDKLYRNKRDGTFQDAIDAVVPHTPFSSMGADLGDVNNDGHIDLLVADMAATTHVKDQRTMAHARGLIAERPDATASPFFMRNALYLNVGIGRMLEAACLAGVAATDWTWSVRFEDLDNDGRLDLHVTNGMHREPHNADLMGRISAATSIPEKIRIERASPVLAEANLAYRNLGDLQFAESGAAWGLNQIGVSFGAAFGDLDGDGDLDLLFSNYRKGVTVLRNDSDAGHAVAVALRGTRSNRFGVGAKVELETAAGLQVRSLVLARGVLSSSEPALHFGVGPETRAKRLTVVWPSGNRQTFADLPVDRRFTIVEPTEMTESSELTTTRPTRFEEVSEASGLALLARQEISDELRAQPLLPLRQNRRGPSVAIADMNGDGRDEVLFGGTPRTPARWLVAGAEGKFASAGVELPADEKLNDGPLLVFDADGDGNKDILTTKGGVARPANAPEYQPQLLVGDGRGGYRLATRAVPPFVSSVGAAAAADFDRSGELDVFLGGRVVPGAYPTAPRSALLRNRGGDFEDVTEAMAPTLRAVGMVTAALWSDVDADGWLDLLLALDWGPVKYFHNERGVRLEEWSERAGFAAAGSGWWTSIAAADFNGDGRIDYAVGNVGLNTSYRADPAHPALLFAGDFKGTGNSELVEGYFDGATLYPRRSRRELGQVLPDVLKRFPRNDAYARATLSDIVGPGKLETARRFAATELRSGVFLSGQDGRFRFEALPRIAQLAPLQGMAAGDFDGDGQADLFAVQNSYLPVPSVGRFDGGLGVWLRGDGHGGFAPVALAESGLVVPGDSEALAVLELDGDGWPDFVVTRNDASALAFRHRGRAGRNSIGLELRGPAGNPDAIGARVTMEHNDGTSQTSEVYAGAGYYSQSAPRLFFGWPNDNPPRRLAVRWPDGRTTEHAVPGSGARWPITPDQD